MNLTSYQAKYFSHELTRQLPSNDIGKFTVSLQDAQVDLNPHQVEAALFAFKSPLSNGAILADEVGLGKTIEAGIILSQQWTERKRCLLIICPSNLRKQWSQELANKFFLPSVILETKSFNNEINEKNFNPFHQKDKIVICSFQFAKSKASYVEATNWNLVIIDEAHRLRNVYKSSNLIGNAIRQALLPRKKVLLTATPLQNSVLELYGLVSIIDDFVFGDLKSFKSQYSRQLEEEDYYELKKRLQSVCKRTLRRQVLEYISYTERRAICEEYIPRSQEQELYDAVSKYLQKPKLYALPRSQRQLMTLILRKLLASSTYAIYGTFDTLVKRLESIVEKHETDIADLFSDEYEALNETRDEWVEDEEESIVEEEQQYSDADIQGIKEEIVVLKEFRELARVIKKNSKADHLFIALDKAFEQLQLLGANQKALIFTESRRTQEYLYNLLTEKKYKDQVVLFNGTNNDPQSTKIYNRWLEKHKGTDKISGSPTADKRSAIVDYFRDNATIMIATEAASEGVNLQFCSLVLNYDMPWNPQRIEQRIGRCHRYGQKFDVVVNFVNIRNQADVRVYELLEQKFRLFDGVFGASDEVLGVIGNGVDFEKRIAQIYQECRTTEEIQSAFDDLQEELKPAISEKLQRVRSILLENFDEEVREKLRVNYDKTRSYLNSFEQKLWKITKYVLKDDAFFNDSDFSFHLPGNPFHDVTIHPGSYKMLRTEEGKKKSDIVVPDDTNIYRVGHKLAQRILQECKSLPTPVRMIEFNYTDTPTLISSLNGLIGNSGWLRVEQLNINSFEDEDYLLLSCITDEGAEIEPEIAQRLFSLRTEEKDLLYLDPETESRLSKSIARYRQEIVTTNALRNRDFFDIEMDKLDQWADDMKISLEKEIKDLDAEIKLRRAEAKKMLSLESKVAAQREIKKLEKERNEKRQSLFVSQDEIDERKENLLTDIEKMLDQKLIQEEVFTIKWRVI
ncbi:MULTISPECIES: SNF2-related protein [unclassified Proteiniphilum]|uniref:SNF2-related protein n=1 Tax=unclassified Proteiniphilum TaxID=2622718 RepID=UPI00257E44D1|nr:MULTISPECIES: SNF2-related protein [unclassified Proteiniphilum]